MVAQSKKKMKNKARLPRTAGLRTLSDLTADLTKAGVDPSRVQERAVIIAKMHAAGRKRKRDEGEDAMDVDGDGNDNDDDNWASEGEGEAMMDVDDNEQGTRHGKRGKANSGASVARKRAPRSNRQLAGLRDEAVRVASCFCRRSFSADGRLFAMGNFILICLRHAHIASIQSGATAEPWSTWAQYARKGGRKRPRYQSQNGAPLFSFRLQSVFPFVIGSAGRVPGWTETRYWKFSVFSVCRWGAKYDRSSLFFSYQPKHLFSGKRKAGKTNRR